MTKLYASSISNNSTLKKIEKHNATLAGKISSIRSAYIQYHSKEGSPTNLKPIKLTKHEGEALDKIYSGETAKYGTRWISDHRAAPAQTYCPLCGGPNPSQLEHYLPKANYPEFTILSWNLVPTCSVCNPKRGHHAHHFKEANPLIHPYYEYQLLSQPIFSATIVRPFSAVSFIPVPSTAPLSPEIITRVERQIDLCFDKEKFNRWLSSKLWKELHAELSGLPEVEATSKIAYKFRIHRATTGMNSWDTIFFRALIADAEAVCWLRKTPSWV